MSLPLATAAGPIDVALNLFDDTAVTVTLVRQPGDLAIVWTGAVPGRPGTSVLLVLSGGYVFGNAHLGTAGEYTIRDQGGGAVMVGQVDPHAIGAEAAPMPVPTNSAEVGAVDATEQAAMARVANPAVDVMILWSVQVLNDKFGGDTAEGRAWATTRVAELNTVFQASGVHAKARLAFAGTADYDNGEDSSPSISGDLDNFTYRAGQNCGGVPDCDPNGYLDTERAQRDLVGSDIAVLIVEDSNEFGIAWLNCRPSTDDPAPNAGGECLANYAFAVVEFDAADLHYTMAHEIGHLLGGSHDAANGGTGYARGYRVTPKFSTVLAYECDPGVTAWDPSHCAPRVGVYSNPDVIWNGDSATPMGKPIGSPHEADNASHFNLSTDIVAGFRKLVTCGGRTATILGTGDGDVINGTGAADVILGFGGADLINAEGGDDRVCAGNGDDEVLGANGSDRLYGGRGSDTLSGGNQSDFLKGGPGNDALDGGPGAGDVLNGGNGSGDSCTAGETYRHCEQFP